MKKTLARFLVLCMALMLAGPLLAQPARASSEEIEPYEGTPLFLVAMMDSNDELAALLNAFLVHDPETGGTFLLGSSVIYDLVQNDYTAFILGDDDFFTMAIPVGKSGGVSYLYTLGLENAPYLVLSEGGGKKAAAMYREMDSNGLGDPIQKNFDLSSGWEENSNGFLTYTGHEIETFCMIGAPMVSTEDSSVLGSITMNDDSEMTLAPLKRGQLSTAYSIETLSGGSPSGSGSSSGSSSSDSGSGSSSGSSSSDSGSGDSDTDTGSGSSASGSGDSAPASGSSSGLVWIAVIAVVGVLGYLIYRANTTKKNAGPKEGTVPLDLSNSGPLPVSEQNGETLPVQEEYGHTVPNYGPTMPASQWQLRCLSGVLSGQVYPISSALRMGRSPQCDIVFPESTPGVSGTHCEVSLEGDHVVLRDLNSTYGTYLGANNRLETHRSYELHMGDTFTLAQNGQSFRLEKLGVSSEEFGPVVKDLAGRTYRADASGRMTFGRSSGNQVRISADEQSVSGSHCVLYREAGKLYLMDLGSTNGTFLSEQERLKPHTPYRIRRGMAFFLSNSRNTYVVTEE